MAHFCNVSRGPGKPGSLTWSAQSLKIPPGTAFPFALTLVELLCGKEKRKEVSKPMVFPPGTPW